MYSFTAALSIILLTSVANAFVVPSNGIAGQSNNVANTIRSNCRTGPVLFATADDSKDAEIEKLKAQAAKLRAEAAALEADKAKEMAELAEKAFLKFDTNQDGEISLEELKEGLEKTLKMEVSESRVKDLMKAFDTSGDGALQLDEFVGIDKFRNKLEALARDEKEAAIQKQLEAKKEAEAAIIAEARANILNDGPPSNTDKLISCLPYLFPLMDGLQFGRFLLTGEDNFAIEVLALIYALYRSIPLGGFIAFFALNILSGFPNLNRLVRFNAQQAIFLDIALFFPGLIASIYTLVLKNGANLPTSVTEIGTDAVFITLLITLAYCTISSLLGIAPNKIPVISKAVDDRMPTIDMFDDQGRFNPTLPEKDDKKDDNDGKKDDK